MGLTMPGHPYLETKNHASKGIHPQEHMGGGGVGSELTHKSMRLGGGGRFEKLEGELAHKGIKNPAALAASIGRKKYGAKKMAKMSAAHR